MVDSSYWSWSKLHYLENISIVQSTDLESSDLETVLDTFLWTHYGYHFILDSYFDLQCFSSKHNVRPNGLDERTRANLFSYSKLFSWLHTWTIFLRYYRKPRHSLTLTATVLYEEIPTSDLEHNSLRSGLEIEYCADSSRLSLDILDIGWGSFDQSLRGSAGAVRFQRLA